MLIARAQRFRLSELRLRHQATWAPSILAGVMNIMDAFAEQPGLLAAQLRGRSSPERTTAERISAKIFKGRCAPAQRGKIYMVLLVVRSAFWSIGKPHPIAQVAGLKSSAATLPPSAARSTTTALRRNRVSATTVPWRRSAFQGAETSCPKKCQPERPHDSIRVDRPTMFGRRRAGEKSSLGSVRQSTSLAVMETPPSG